MTDDYRYDARLVRVVDGDTVDLSVDLGFRIFGKLRFRVLGIDTPEKAGRTRSMGLAATSYVEHLFTIASAVEVLSLGEPDKYGGRWDGRVSMLLPAVAGVPAARIDLAEHLVGMGFAQRYSGAGPRPAWSPDVPYPLPADRR